MKPYCAHTTEETVTDAARFPAEGCADCSEDSPHWVALRMCTQCGHVGCCDSSAGKHATKHFHETGHPIMRSVESGDDWGWCYVDEGIITPAPHAPVAVMA
ncbi:MAG: Na+/H+ antiporter [Pseudonocardiales bacterium]|nr:Na+/H+ antiporter [Pseudonocardiales bacterium]